MRPIIKIILLNLIGFLIFLVFLGVANISAGFIQSPIFHSIVQFLNSNILFLFGLSVLLMTAEIFWVLVFPFNLPAPLFSAISSIFVVSFIFKIVNFINTFTEEHIPWDPEALYLIIYPIVFLIVLIIGYLSIFVRLSRRIKTSKPSKEKEKKKNK